MSGDSVALLFTDIEGSTRLLDLLGAQFEELVAEHHRLIREAITAARGREVHTAGDSFFAVFQHVQEAVACAVEVQMAMGSARWPDGNAPRVRIGIHIGAPTVREGEFIGMDVHRAARVMAVAHGGQILMTEPARRELDGAEARDLGHHRLKDLPAPEHLFQLVAPGLRTEFPPLRSLNRSNLPTPANPLVGRRGEVSDLLARLARPEIRLLTLLGPGGSGKTRLAIEVAAEAAGRYRDGVWLVLLAPLPDPSLMVAEIARVLEVDAVVGRPLERALATALTERELLLVLDNFEHLLDGAGVVADVLAAAPRVDVMVTSREPVRISGEHRLDVPPLPRDDAGELFTQRALAVRPDLVLEDEDARAIERICDRLDGLPLAVELAAARVSAFSPRALEARVAEGLQLAAGPRDLPERQRTLRATIDWSYRLLEPAEQRQLAALSPFVGGIRLDTAELLWGRQGGEGLISLAEKSLLRRREDADGEPRFWMLELIRQYATEVAEADGVAAEAVDRHARSYYALTEQARPMLVGPDQREWLDRLEREHANLRAALEHFTERRADEALRMASTLTWFWDVRGYHPEARRRLDEALLCVPPGSPSRGDALHCAGWMAWNQGDPETAQTLQRAALPLLLETGDQRLIAQTYSHLATVAEMLRDYDEAVPWHEEAIATARAAGDNWALGVALNNYAIMRTRRRDTERAMSLLEDALTALRKTGDAYTISIAVANVAEYALISGDPHRAEMLVEEALELGRQIGFRPLIAGMFELGAAIALELDDVETAATQAREAFEVGIPFQGESMALRLTVAGAMAAIRRQPLRAAMLWGAAEHGYAQIGVDDRPIHARLLARWEPQARADASDEAGWDAAWTAGAQMTIEDALAVAADWSEHTETAHQTWLKPPASV